MKAFVFILVMYIFCTILDFCDIYRGDWKFPFVGRRSGGRVCTILWLLPIVPSLSMFLDLEGDVAWTFMIWFSLVYIAIYILVYRIIKEKRDKENRK